MKNIELNTARGKPVIERWKPKLSLPELEYLIRDRNIEISDDGFFRSAKVLLRSAIPAHEDQHERRWENFLLPLRRAGKFIVLPFGVVEYQGRFYFHFPLVGGFSIGPGDKSEDRAFRNLLRDASKFARLSRTIPSKAMIAKIPYDYRFGRIKGIYVLERLLPKRIANKYASSYRAHQDRKLKTPSVSLNEYFNAAAICYRAAFGAKARRLSPLGMYNKWADRRDGGMLSIKNKDSRRAFGSWYRGGRWAGSHPFEIVFSWIDHGIHLYPPSKGRPYFSISVTNFGYVGHYLRMVLALIKSNVPFQAEQFAFVLDYLSGETFFTVNERGDHDFRYIPSEEYRRRYFRHIEWEIPRLVEFKEE